MPLTIPEASTSAIEGALLLQVPPGVAFVNWEVEGVQIFTFPTIGATTGGALTVTVALTEFVQPFVLVKV